MKRTTLILIIFLNISLAYSQPFVFKKHIIDSTINGCAGLFSGDIDNDGDIDISGTSLNNNEILLWLNSGKKHISWQKVSIDSTVNAPLYIHMNDLNNDGKVDILAGSGEGEIAWWETYKNDVSKWIKHVVDTGFAGAHGILACDLNNDTYTDIVASSANLHSIAWWENAGDNPPTWTKHIICENFHASQSCFAIDIDNDGDMEVIGASSDDDELAVWYNLNGTANDWEKQTITDSFDLAHWVYSCDLDNDGDNDILGAACIDAEIAWWENDGQSPPAWTKHPIGNGFACALTVLATDFNNDNCTDVYASAWMDNEVSVWENIRDPSLKWIKHTHDTSLFGAWPVHANDIDGDGDMDLIAGGDLLNRAGTNPPLCWWENQLFTARSAMNLSKDKALKELDIIHTSLGELHPGLTLYRSEAEIESKYDSIYSIVYKSDTIKFSECLLLYKELSNYINCGHTIIYDPGLQTEDNVTFQEKDYTNLLKKELIENGVCKLILPTFYTVDLKKNRIRYKNYLKSFFREARKRNCKEIVIDIRGNRGGSVHMAAYLASFIIDSSFTFFNSVELTEQKSITYENHIEKDAFFRLRRLITTRKGDKRYYMLHRELRPRKPHRLSPGPDTEIKILIDGNTFSAATMFAAVCRAKSDAVFTGKETAGKCIGSGLSPIKLTLPYSHFIIEIPLAYIYLSTNNLEQDTLHRGILPDSITVY